MIESAVEHLGLVGFKGVNGGLGGVRHLLVEVLMMFGLLLHVVRDFCQYFGGGGFVAAVA